MSRALFWSVHHIVAGAVCCAGCGGESTQPEPTLSAIPSASITGVADIANNGNGSDLLVAFTAAANEMSVTEYRVLVIPQGDAAGYDAAAAGAVPPGRYTVVPTGQTAVAITLAADAADVAGNLIGEAVAYVAHVLVVVDAESASDNQLSNPSAAITLAQTDLVITLTDVIQAGSGGMAVDADGNIYSADFGTALSGPPGTRVFKITPAGAVSVFASGLSGASGNAFDSKGDLFQSNIAGNRISRITPDGTVTIFVSNGLAGPVGIAIDADDNLFVANCGNNTIRKVTVDRVSTPFASGSLFSCPNGIALADDGNLYVANFGNGRVIKVAPDGTASSFVQVPGNNNGHITWANGVLYVVARAGHRIYQLTLSGELTALAGSGTRGLWDGAALDATLSLTNDIAVSPDGTILYFNDVVNQTGTDIVSPIVIRQLILR